MSKKKKPDFIPEWAYPVEVTNLGGSARRMTISPPPEIRKALVPRLGIASLESLEADLEFARNDGSAVLHVTGLIRAHFTQNCVVTLEPIEVELNENFEAWFADPEEVVSFTKARHDRKLSKGSVEMPVLDERDDPEPIIEGRVDAGELVVQHLSLAINPYPHKEGVQYEIGDDTVPDIMPDTQKNPFAALKDWKNRLKQGDT